MSNMPNQAIDVETSSLDDIIRHRRTEETLRAIEERRIEETTQMDFEDDSLSLMLSDVERIATSDTRPVTILDDDEDEEGETLEEIRRRYYEKHGKGEARACARLALERPTETNNSSNHTGMNGGSIGVRDLRELIDNKATLSSAEDGDPHNTSGGGSSCGGGGKSTRRSLEEDLSSFRNTPYAYRRFNTNRSYDGRWYQRPRDARFNPYSWSGSNDSRRDRSRSPGPHINPHWRARSRSQSPGPSRPYFRHSFPGNGGSDNRYRSNHRAASPGPQAGFQRSHSPGPNGRPVYRSQSPGPNFRGRSPGPHHNFNGPFRDWSSGPNSFRSQSPGPNSSNFQRGRSPGPHRSWSQGPFGSNYRSHSPGPNGHNFRAQSPGPNNYRSRSPGPNNSNFNFRSQSPGPNKEPDQSQGQSRYRSRSPGPNRHNFRAFSPGPNFRAHSPGPNYRAHSPGPNYRAQSPGPNGRNYRSQSPGPNQSNFRSRSPGPNGNFNRSQSPGPNRFNNEGAQNHRSAGFTSTYRSSRSQDEFPRRSYPQPGYGNENNNESRDTDWSPGETREDTVPLTTENLTSFTNGAANSQSNSPTRSTSGGAVFGTNINGAFMRFS
uniref:Uncharacterized protein n=1 Tax=Cacopsylla melanoneura TaxID=428564 RepID=A0A8D8Q7W9_9HEMI